MDDLKRFVCGGDGEEMRDAVKGLLVAILICVFVLLGGQRTTMARDNINESEPGTKVEILEDPDDPVVWDIVRSFHAQPTPENTKMVFQFLEEKCEKWDSHPAGLITTILETIGDHKVNSGRKYLVRFLYTKPELEGAAFIQSSAARNLGVLGGPGALEELVGFAKNAPPGVLPSVAVGLGELGDPQAVPSLEALAGHGDGKTRARALSALANYCSATSRALVLRQIADADQNIMMSAEWWLSACSTTDDGARLVSLLHDGSDLVRLEALRGLVRLRSRAACGMCDRLFKDKSEFVVELAKEYSKICKQSEP